MSIITFTTDFGTMDPYVAEMKGRILALHPAATLVDVTHGIEPGAIREGAWIVSRAWKAFPRSTIHLAVVDPGVGSTRRALATRIHGQLFLGPDNGLLHPVLLQGDGGELREITGQPGASRRGTTFDGRDLFAPAAGALASGVPFHEIGPPIHDPIALEPFRAAREGDSWIVEIVAIDRYGNLVTCAEESYLKSELGESWPKIQVSAGAAMIQGIRSSYAEVSAGQFLLTIGSAGTLEISKNRGNAAAELGLKTGDLVRIDIG